MNRRCPVCNKEDIWQTDAKGFLEKNVFPIILLRSYRCRMCRNRFYGFALQDGAGNLKRAKRRKRAQQEQFERFLKPLDEKEFRQLIAEIAEAERKRFGEQPKDQPADQADILRRMRKDAKKTQKNVVMG